MFVRILLSEIMYTQSLLLSFVLMQAAFFQSVTPGKIWSKVIAGIDKALGIFEQKCLINTNPTQFRKIFKSFVDTASCIIYPSTPRVTEYCAFIGKDFFSCLKQTVYVLLPCLNDLEKNIPDFIVDGLKRILNKFCTSDNIERFEKLSMNCVGSIEAGLKEHFLTNCVPKLNLMQNAKEMAKNIVCQDLKTIEECVLDFIKTKCEMQRDDLELVNSVLDEYKDECLSVRSTGSMPLYSFVIIIMSLIITNI